MISTKQTLPGLKGFALCDRCYGAALKRELAKHKAYTRRTYTGSFSHWSRDQVRYLAVSLGVHLELYKRGHRVHIGEGPSTAANINEHDSEADTIDMPQPCNDSESNADKFTTFGKQFLSLMEKRPDIDKSIKEILRSKLKSSPSINSRNQTNINAPDLTIPTVNQPSPLPFPPSPSSLPAHLHPLPFALPRTLPPLSSLPQPVSPFPNSTHNYTYNFVVPTTPLPCLPSVPTNPNASNNININFNLYLSNNNNNTSSTRK